MPHCNICIYIYIIYICSLVADEVSHLLQGQCRSCCGLCASVQTANERGRSMRTGSFLFSRTFIHLEIECDM